MKACDQSGPKKVCVCGVQTHSPGGSDNSEVVI